MVLVCSALLLATGHFQTPDAHLRLAQAQAWMDGQLALPDDTGNPAHGNVVVTPDGARFAVYPPGQSLLFLPALVLSGLAGPFVGPSADPHYRAAFIGTFATLAAHFAGAYVLFLLAAAVWNSRRHAALIALVFAFATPGLVDAASGYDHSQETLLVLLAVLAGLRAREKGSRTGFALAGLALGTALLFRTSAVLALPGLALLAPAWRYRGWLLTGVLPGLAAITLYNALRFGTPFETGYLAAWTASVPGPATDHAFTETPLLTGLAGLWLSPGKGLLALSPVLIAALAGFPRLWRRDPPLAAAAALTIAGYSVLYGVNWAWHGSEWSWGPRYILPAVPLLCLGLRVPRNRALRTGLGALIALSAAAQLAGTAVDFRRPLVGVLVSAPEAFATGHVLWHPRYHPPLRQLGTLGRVAGRQAEQPLEPFLAPGPWKNEERPASQVQMLRRSVDFNSWNTWWARAQHLAPAAAARTAACLAALLTAATGLGFGVAGLRRLPSSRSPSRCASDSGP